MLSCVAAAVLAGGAGAAGQANRTETIYDPGLRMKAYDVTIPADWKYQGTLVQGDSCDDTPTPVFRAYSPDGLSEFRRMPRFDWSWGNAPYAGPQQGDCLPLKSAMPAIDFARSLAKLQGANFIGEMRLNARTAQSFRQALDEDNAAIQKAAGQRPFSGDAAAARVEFQNGSFVIEEQLRVLIRCSRQNQPGFGGQQYFKENCGAEVRAIRAPKGKLDALVDRIDTGTTGAVVDARWEQALINARQKQVDKIVADGQELMRQRQAQFDQAQKVRAQQNRDYQASLQAGYAAHNAQAAAIQGQYADHNGKVMANMDARHTPASDWVDFALDQQTVSGTGGTAVKVPSGYSQVWANQSGQYYVTNNLNTNPNGSMPGEWTPQTQVHGNGRPY